MAYVIAEPCIDVMNRACVEECPVDCIYQGERMLYIHPVECVDCGACEPTCPVDAIYEESQIPTEWDAFRGANAQVFEGLHNLGGATIAGPLGRDCELVAKQTVIEE